MQEVLDAGIPAIVGDNLERRYELLRMRKFESYIKVRVFNTGRKKASGVTLRGKVWEGFHYQVDESNSGGSIDDSGALVIGDIQPKDHRVVHLWSVVTPDIDNKDTLKVSADEVDAVSYRFPLPDYLAKRVVVWRNGLLFLCGLAILVVWSVRQC
jgi:hypothetical protein